MSNGYERRRLFSPFPLSSSFIFSSSFHILYIHYYYAYDIIFFAAYYADAYVIWWWDDDDTFSGHCHVICLKILLIWKREIILYYIETDIH